MREYNPEGSALRTDQKEMVRMLQAFAEICKQHDIRWWLCSGTLLGAARHGGFIPWDDDLDVSMMKKDYKKLKKILINLESEDYAFQCIQTDPEYVNLVGKFRNKKTERPSTDIRARYFKYRGHSFDVFYIEKSSRFASHLAKFFYNNMQHPTMYIKNTRLRRFMVKLVLLVNIYFLIPLARLIGLINPKNQYHYALGAGFYDEPFYEKNIFPLTEIEFEGIRFPAPNDVDAYLTAMYGDWRKLPTEEQIRKSLHSPLYIEEIFGKD